MMNVECMNQIENIYTDGQDTIVDVKSMPYFDLDPYDVYDDKDFNKYITALEMTVRMSFEYRQLINYLRNSEGMDECAFLSNVSNRDNTKVKIEIHHSPLTLYDICMAVYKKRQNNKEPIGINDVAEEVMWLHYMGWVGLIPLSKSVHEMVHNQYLAVPTDVVRGNYQAFINAYYNFISPDVLDAVDALEQWTKDYNGKQMEVFNNHRIYVNANGSYALPQKDQTKDIIKEKISDIKNNKPTLRKMIRHITK